MTTPQSSSPLVGRGGVRLVALDLIAGVSALPAAALSRELLGAMNSPLGAPGGSFREIERIALWAVALLSVILWPLALRAVDPGYPSTRLPARRILIAALIWLFASSGAIYLLDKSLASRALVLFAAIIIAGVAFVARRVGARERETFSPPQVALPQLGAQAEQALSRGEPISISLERLELALPRPTIILEAGRIWIYPSVLSPTERLIKRVLDVLLAVLLIGVLSPFILLTAMLILVKDGRPIF